MIAKVEFKKVREFGEIISDTFLFIKQNFKPLVKTFFYFCGFFVLGGIISTILYQLDLIGTVNSLALGTPNGFSGYFDKIFSLNYFLIMLFAYFNYTAIYVCMQSFISLYTENNKTAPSIEQVWGYFKFYYFRVFFSSFPLGILLIIGFVCCFIPGIYFFPVMSLFYPVMMVENGTFGYSFGRSFKLLNNQWWATAVTLFIIWLITYLFMAIGSIPGALIMMIKTFMPNANSFIKYYVIFSSIFQAIFQVFMIIPIICTSFCYFNLVERKESAGLLGRIDQLGNNNNDLNTTPEEY